MLPLYVDVSDKRIVVFGGGIVAERKIRQILDTNSIDGKTNIEVHSLDFIPQIEAMTKQGVIRCFKSDLWELNIGEIVKGAFLILICTDDRPLNDRILKEAAKFELLINYSNYGDAFMSSVINKGGFIISVSTAGKGPAMARYMKKKIAALVGEKEAKMLQIQSRLRRYLKQRIKDEKRRRKILNSVLDDPECWSALDAPIDIAEKVIFRIVGDRYA
jgi:precorrin-2 dehydrogenase/sirohydrochlorin ferrochelatase